MTNSLSENDSDEAMRAHNNSRQQSRRRLRVCMFAGLLFGILFGPYLFYRAASFQERVRVFQIADSESGAIPANNDIETPDQLRIMTWNIAHGRGIADSNWSESAEPKIRRIMEIADFIEQQDADIVVLNEVDFATSWSGGFDQAETIAVAAGYPWYARQSNLDFGFLAGRFKFGNVILSRFPIDAAEAVNLPPHAVWEDWLAGRKRGLNCTIKIGDQDINVIGLHLESRGDATRVKSANFLNEYLAALNGPTILAGDLNTSPPETRTLSTKSDFRNSFELLAGDCGLKHVPDVIYDSGQFTFPSTKPAATIDWLFYHPDYFQPLEHNVLQTELSDHLPVVVQLQRK